MRPIVLLVRSLDAGGAERQVVALATGLHRAGLQVQVVTFYGGGLLDTELGRAGVPHHCLNKRGRWDVFGFLVRLVKHLRQVDARVLYAFLPVPNIVAALIRPLLRNASVVWGVRSSEMDLDAYDWLARLVYRVEALLVWIPALVISNSHAGARFAVRRGFPPARIVVIPNGIDKDVFAFDAHGRGRVRRELGLTEDDVVIGVVARLDPMKGHEVLIRAAPGVLNALPHAKFVCVGDGDVSLRERLAALARSLCVENSIRWSPARSDMAALYSAFDIFCLPSLGEGFSNAIAEAMACGRACVVSDVGDSAQIVYDCGRVVPPGDATALARALIELVTSDLAAASVRCRERIMSNFSAEQLVSNTLRALNGFRSVGTARAL